MDDILNCKHVEIDKHTGDSGYILLISGTCYIPIDFIVNEFTEIGSLLIITETVESIHIAFNYINIIVDDCRWVMYGDSGVMHGGSVGDIQVISRTTVHICGLIAVIITVRVSLVLIVILFVLNIVIWTAIMCSVVVVTVLIGSPALWVIESMVWHERLASLIRNTRLVELILEIRMHSWIEWHPVIHGIQISVSSWSNDRCLVGIGYKI